jgi:hypothetical protein
MQTLWQSGITLDLLTKAGLCTEGRKKRNKILEVQSINHTEQPLKKQKREILSKPSLDMSKMLVESTGAVTPSVLDELCHVTYGI